MNIFCREVKPFAPLIWNEIRFWLRILKEHAILIYWGLPSDQTELKQEAQQFQWVFEDLEKRSCETSGGEGFSCFIEIACTAVKNFFAFNRHILHCLIECELCGGCLYPLLIDHMSREALYSLKLLQKFCDDEMPYQVDAITSENVFWLRIIADHLKFSRDLLDPSERQMNGRARQMGEEFEQLGLQARDLDSMLWHYQPTNVLIRFEKDVNDATVRLQNFQTAIDILVKQCAAVSLFKPLLADHIRRETEHFLMIMELIRKELLNCEQVNISCRDND